MRLLELSRCFLRRDISISPLHRHGDLHLFFSTTPTATSSADAASPKPHFMAEYLVSTCGLSPEAAAKAAKPLSHLTSTAKPDAFVAFLRSQGFHAAQIRKLASGNPTLLCSNVDTNLSPKLQAIRALGFDQSEVADLIVSYPTFVNHSLHRTVLPRTAFWLGLLGSTKLLMKCLRMTMSLLRYHQDTVSQNLSLLRSLGIPENRIFMVLKQHPMLVLMGPAKFRALVERVEACGFPPGSAMFVWGLVALHGVTEPGFQAKKEVMMSLGWSEEQFLATFRRAPTFLSVSEGLMRRKVEFLKGKAGCSTEDIVQIPALLMYSLEKRMMPRYHAIEILKSKGVHLGGSSFSTVMVLSEIKFMDKYILRHKERVPELLKLYPSKNQEDDHLQRGGWDHHRKGSPSKGQGRSQ